MRRFILPLLALAIVVGPPLAYARFRAFHYRNFRVVAADRLYRSGQLSPYGLGRVWHEFGIGTVITLREDDELKGTAGGDWEARWCKEHEVAFVRLPPQRWHVKGQGPVPAQANVDRFLEVLTNPDRYPRPVLLHCFKGTHRTGVFVALYRMEIEGWTNEEAIAELMTLGYDNLEEEPDVYDYLRSYQPKLKATPRAGGVSRLSEAASATTTNLDPEVRLAAFTNHEPISDVHGTTPFQTGVHEERCQTLAAQPIRYRDAIEPIESTRRIDRSVVALRFSAVPQQPPDDDKSAVLLSFGRPRNRYYVGSSINDALLSYQLVRNEAAARVAGPVVPQQKVVPPQLLILARQPAWLLGDEPEQPANLPAYLGTSSRHITLRFYCDDLYLGAFTLLRPLVFDGESLAELILELPFAGMDSLNPAADPRELLVDRWFEVRGTLRQAEERLQSLLRCRQRLEAQRLQNTVPLGFYTSITR